MAVKKMGTSYVVGADSTAEAAYDSNIYYRGWKDFLVWVPSYNANQQVSITAYSSESKKVKAALYRCRNLLDDPGTFVDDGSATGTPTSEGGASFTLDFGPAGARLSGLFRLRVKPKANEPFFQVNFKNLPWYSLECIEPRFGYYSFGVGNKGSYSHYFFIPHLDEDETVQVRLGNESSTDAARLDIYKLGEEDDALLTLEVSNRWNDDNKKHRFATGEISADDLPTSDPGGIYCFKLYRPGDDEHPDPLPSVGPAGNAWVRLSNNVPSYFSPNPKGLIYPILHRDFPPVLATGSTAKYRAFLTVDRSETSIIALGCRVYVTVGDDTEDSGINGYSAEVSLTPESGAELTGDQVVAQVRNAEIVVADSDDKMNKIWLTQPPEYGSDWERPILLAYDNNGGKVTSPKLYRPGYFNTVQTTADENLAPITTPGNGAMKAAGVMYPNPEEPDTPRDIKVWYCANVRNAQDSRIRFWMMWDEPDAGVGEQMWLRRDIYDMYWKYNNYADKPYSLNISQPVFYADYFPGCDVAIFDPFVKNPTDPLNELTDATAEANRVTRENQKTIVVLWWWIPTDKDYDATTAANFNRSFEAIKDDVDGIGGWNYGGLWVNPDDRSDRELRRLATYDNADIEALWDAICDKNESVTPS